MLNRAEVNDGFDAQLQRFAGAFRFHGRRRKSRTEVGKKLGVIPIIGDDNRWKRRGRWVRLNTRGSKINRLQATVTWISEDVYKRQVQNGAEDRSLRNASGDGSN